MNYEHENSKQLDWIIRVQIGLSILFSGSAVSFSFRGSTSVYVHIALTLFVFCTILCKYKAKLPIYKDKANRYIMSVIVIVLASSFINISSFSPTVTGICILSLVQAFLLVYYFDTGEEAIKAFVFVMRFFAYTGLICWVVFEVIGVTRSWMPIIRLASNSVVSYRSIFIHNFIDDFMHDKNMDEYDIISLDKIDSIQIIDDASISFDVDMNALYKKSIPKEINSSNVEVKEKKGISISYIFFALFLIVLALFFFFNPEVLKGEDIKYVCDKKYDHEVLPARIDEKVELVFNAKGNITSIDITSDYIFNDTDYYNEYRDNGYFYQYMNKGDTYKFIDDTYTYRVFSKIDTSNDYFMPTKLDELISYYKDNNYSCKEENIE